MEIFALLLIKLIVDRMRHKIIIIQQSTAFICFQVTKCDQRLKQSWLEHYQNHKDRMRHLLANLTPRS